MDGSYPPIQLNAECSGWIPRQLPKFRKNFWLLWLPGIEPFCWSFRSYMKGCSISGLFFALPTASYLPHWSQNGRIISFSFRSGSNSRQLIEFCVLAMRMSWEINSKLNFSFPCHSNMSRIWLVFIPQMCVRDTTYEHEGILEIAKLTFLEQGLSTRCPLVLLNHRVCDIRSGREDVSDWFRHKSSDHRIRITILYYRTFKFLFRH